MSQFARALDSQNTYIRYPNYPIIIYNYKFITNRCYTRIFGCDYFKSQKRTRVYLNLLSFY